MYWGYYSPQQRWQLYLLFTYSIVLSKSNAVSLETIRFNHATRAVSLDFGERGLFLYLSRAFLGILYVRSISVSRRVPRVGKQTSKNMGPEPFVVAKGLAGPMQALLKT